VIKLQFFNFSQESLAFLATWSPVQFIKFVLYSISLLTVRWAGGCKSTTAGSSSP